jgi:hypothetical protein
MKKYILVLVISLGVTSAHAGVLSTLSKFASSKAFSYLLSNKTTQYLGAGFAANLITAVASHATEDAVIKPVFDWKAPTVDLPGLGMTAAGVTAEHYAAPVITQSAMYLLGMTAVTNPYSAVVFGLVSQLAVGNALSKGMQLIL